MNNRDRHFKGQQDTEELICFFRHHWIVLFKDLFLFAIFTVGIAVSMIKFDDIVAIIRGNYEFKLLFASGFLLATAYIHRFFMRLLTYFINIGIITDIRIIDHDRTLFFRDSMDSIDLSQIQNIEQIKEGLVPYVFKVGDIKVFMTASSATKTFYNVPNAKFHFRCMNRAKEARQLALRVRGDISKARREEHKSVIPQNSAIIEASTINLLAPK